MLNIQNAIKEGLSKEEILQAVEAEYDEYVRDTKELDAVREEYIKAMNAYYNALGRETTEESCAQAVKMSEKYIKEPKELSMENIFKDLFADLR